MRDTFYHWLVLLMFMAMFFGAAMARAAAGSVNVVEIVVTALAGVASAAALGAHYRSAKAQQTPQAPLSAQAATDADGPETT